MNAQDIFYTLGSIYLALGIIFMVVLITTLLFVVKKMREIEREVKVRVEQEIRELKEKPRLLAGYIGHIIVTGIKNSMRDKA